MAPPEGQQVQVHAFLLMTRSGSLTVSTPHSSVVVGDGDEVVATWPGVGVDQELGHVQITAEHKTHTHTHTQRHTGKQVKPCRIYITYMQLHQYIKILQNCVCARTWVR